MNAYIDLSIIVFLFNYLLSLVYSFILFDDIKHKIRIIIISVILSIFSYIINMFFIPYFFIMYTIIYALVLGVICLKYIKIIIVSLIIYYINCALLLLIGGCFLYQGTLLISIPFISIFILIQPIYITFIHIVCSLIYKYIKNKNYILKCKIIINENIIKDKGYYDSGNIITHNDLPVIFVKGHTSNNNGELIKVKGINDYELKYVAYKGMLVINKKNINVYVVFVSNNLSFNGCKILLNKYVM